MFVEIAHQQVRRIRKRHPIIRRRSSSWFKFFKESWYRSRYSRTAVSGIVRVILVHEGFVVTYGVGGCTERI